MTAPIIEMTKLDAAALRELVEGLIAANRALEARIAALEAGDRYRQAATNWPKIPHPAVWYGNPPRGGVIPLDADLGPQARWCGEPA